jgi:general stress protein YciG
MSFHNFKQERSRHFFRIRKSFLTKNLIMANKEGGNRGNNKSERGFASMDDEQQREIASKGGKASQGGERQNQSASNNRGGSSRDNKGGRGSSDRGRGNND